MPPRSLALRFTALVALAVLVSSAAGFALTYFQSVQVLRRQLDNAIAADVDSLLDEYRMLGLDGLRAAVAARAAREDHGPMGFAVRLQGLEGEGGSRKAVVTGRPFEAPRALQGFAEVPRPDGHWARALGIVLPGGAELVIAADLAPLQRTAGEFAATLFGAGALTAILAVLSGLVLARRLERRLAALSDAARAVMAGDLTRRLPEAGTGDELDRLTATINTMLARIEALMVALRQVTNDIAHDLRSPLARLRQRLEATLASSHSPEPDTAMLETALAELDQVLATFAAMLRIAQAEAGVHRAFAPLDLSALVAAVTEAYVPVAEDRGASLVAEVAPGQRITGDAALLRQLLANLVENALAHGGKAVHIQVSLRPGPELEVADDGPGIPPEERGKVLRRFYRLDRSRGTPGTGLGLALVAALAKLHGARLTLGDAGPGLRVTMDLAAAAERS